MTTEMFSFRGLPECKVFADGSVFGRFTRSLTPIKPDLGDTDKKYRWKNSVKRAVRSKCIVLGSDKSFSCWFITLTCSDFIESNEVVSDFIENLRKQGVVNQYVWVRERQKRGANHWHVLFNSKLTWLDFVKVKRSWNRVLQRYGYSVSNNSVRFGSRPKVNNIKAVSNYICKYMSKGGDSEEIIPLTHSSRIEYKGTIKIENLVSCEIPYIYSFVNNFFGFVRFDSNFFYDFYRKYKEEYEIRYN
jgi:hypothetical protein